MSLFSYNILNSESHLLCGKEISYFPTPDNYKWPILAIGPIKQTTLKFIVVGLLPSLKKAF